MVVPVRTPKMVKQMHDVLVSAMPPLAQPLLGVLGLEFPELPAILPLVVPTQPFPIGSNTYQERLL